MARTTIKLSEGVKDAREQALEQANEALRGKIGWIMEWQQRQGAASILGRWELGQEIDEIWRDQKQGGKIYGRSSKRVIALFMQEDPSIVNMAHKLYTTYRDYKRLKEITEMRMQDGVTYLSYSHMRQLLAIKDEQTRHELLNRCLEECWTSSQLGVAVQELNGGKQSNNPNGRGVAIPANAETVIGQMIDFADDFESRNIKVWKDPRHSVAAQVEKLEPIQYTEDLAKKLGELAHRMRQLANEANARAEEAERKYEEVNRVLKMGTEEIAPVVVLRLPNEEADETRMKRGDRPAGRRAKVG
jgi:hypothetical protein